MGVQSSILGRSRDLSLLYTGHIDAEAQSASCQMGTGVVSPGVKRARSEADHSSSSAEVKNRLIYNSISLRVFMALCLIKPRVNFIFYSASASPVESWGSTYLNRI
jgi:hypothetical protein